MGILDRLGFFRRYETEGVMDDLPLDEYSQEDVGDLDAHNKAPDIPNPVEVAEAPKPKPRASRKRKA